MLNSRKLFKALAVTGLLTLGSVASYAQTCGTVTASASKALRAEGVTELGSSLTVAGCSSLPAAFTVTVDLPTGFLVANNDTTLIPTYSGTGAGTATFAVAGNRLTISVTGAAAPTTFDIGNLRLNVAGAAAAAGSTVPATVFISAGTSAIGFPTSPSLGIVLASPSVNFAVTGLATSSISLAACANYPQGNSVAGFLRFTENTISALRDAATEANVIPPAPVPSGWHGTQLRATITGLPAGVTVYAPNSLSFAANAGTTLKMVSGVSTTDSYGGTSANPVPGYTAPTGTTPYIAGYGAVTGDIIYEVITTDITVAETFAIPVIVKLTGGPAVGIGTATATGGLAPIAAGSLPQFSGTGGVTANLLTTTICSTSLLFPYVTTDAGFDTGIAISNTTADPSTFGTSAQSGTCSINAFGAYGSGSVVPAAGTSPAVAAGRTWAFSATDSAVFASGAKLGPGFNGYLIAQCNFQLAHGYAFISTYGLSSANSVAQGYLALVLGSNSGSRVSGQTIETLGN